MPAMQRAILFHNPGAGAESHTKEQLLELVAAEGFECEYVSVKETRWQDRLNTLEGKEKKPDFLIIAGGDGTVRKVSKELLLHTDPARIPIALIPLGTANNIATSLGLKGHVKDIIAGWKQGKLKKFD